MIMKTKILQTKLTNENEDSCITIMVSLAGKH